MQPKYEYLKKNCNIGYFFWFFENYSKMLKVYPWVRSGKWGKDEKYSQVVRKYRRIPDRLRNTLLKWHKSEKQASTVNESLQS